MINKNLIGRESEPVRIKIETRLVQRFADAAGIPFSNQVPPTFVGTFANNHLEELNLHNKILVHEKQEITYFQPVAVGDWITCTQKIADVIELSPRHGNRTVVIMETLGGNPTGDLVFKIVSTLVILERRGQNETPLGLSS